MIIIIGLVTFSILYVNVKPFRNKVDKTCKCRKRDYKKKDADHKLNNQYYKYDDEIKSHQYVNDQKLTNNQPRPLPQELNMKNLINQTKQDVAETDYYDVNLDNIEGYNK